MIDAAEDFARVSAHLSETRRLANNWNDRLAAAYRATYE
jgi:hypothetical protein